MDKKIEIPKSELNNLISDALAAGGYNYQNLTPDGTIGKNIRKGLLEFFSECDDGDHINLIIRLLRAGGYNQALETDGIIGGELIKAANALLEENDQATITQDEIDQSD
mgnify:CR=1 FL=1